MESLNDQAQEQMAKSEAAGEEGKVDEAEQHLREAENLKQQAREIDQRRYPNKTLEVCEVSGVFMSTSDSEARRQDHYQGKQYTGWKAIREKLAELQRKDPPQPPRQGGKR